MSFSFWALNLKGMLRLFSGVSRCCEREVRHMWRGVGVGEARRTYHVQAVAPGRGRDTELALLLSRGGAQDTRAAAESPGCEFGGHRVVVCE
jgi:hypothetical protein